MEHKYLLVVVVFKEPHLSFCCVVSKQHVLAFLGFAYPIPLTVILATNSMIVKLLDFL